MSALRLLVVASTFPAEADDGTPAFVRDLAQEASREFDTVVLVPSVPGGAARERAGRVEVRRFRYFPRRWEDLAHGAILENLKARRTRWLQVAPFLVCEALALRRAVREHRPDVLHLHWMIPQGLTALVVARRVPWVLTTLGGDVYALHDPVSVGLKRAILRRCGAVTTMNTDMRRRLVDLGADEGSTHVLPMGVDLTGVAASAARGRDPVAGRILFAGRLVEKKGAAVLLEALRGLPADLTWSLDIVGDGPLRAPLERAAHGLPVQFSGQLGRNALYDRYNQAEVVVVPSVPTASGDQDGLPLVLCEAMSSGVAVVGSDLPGINEAVRDEISGLLVPAGDPTALGAALERVLREDDLRRWLGSSARTDAARFSLTTVGQSYREILRKVAS